MTKTFTDITAPRYRCSIGACPAVYTDRTPEPYRCDISVSCPTVLDDDSGNFIFIGEELDPVPEELAGKVGETEAAVRLPADLVLASLGVNDLVEAAKPIVNALEKNEQWLVSILSKLGSDETEFKITQGQARALRSVLNKVKGGA